MHQRASAANDPRLNVAPGSCRVARPAFGTRRPIAIAQVHDLDGDQGNVRSGHWFGSGRLGLDAGTSGSAAAAASSVAGFLLMGVGGWYGGRLVCEYGVAVKDRT
jgi:hypothetical protein